MLKLPHKIGMIGCKQIDQYLFFHTAAVSFHSIHEIIHTLPAASAHMLLQPAVYYDFLLAQVYAIVLFHVN